MLMIVPTFNRPCFARVMAGCALLVAMAMVAAPASAQTPTPPRGNTGSRPTVENLYKDFIHYAKLGRFNVADARAKALLAHPELDAVRVLRVSEEDPTGRQTLIRLIAASTIPESAARVLALLREGQNEERKSGARILTNIELLGGDPAQERYARSNLAQSGEYAIPLMLEALLDPSREALWPRIISALRAIGKSAVNPLIAALAVNTTNVRLNIIRALGEIGYPQAIPYLRKIIGDDLSPQNVKEASALAIERIEDITGRPYPGSAYGAFYDLGLQFYNQHDAVRADPRLAEANVWYWDTGQQLLIRKVVPEPIFGQVMAMRCANEALLLRPEFSEAQALWIGANIRRESRLGFNVESDDPEETGELDSTRPDVFLRALAISQAAGPHTAHRVLDRAVRDQDSDVALGAIAALHATAGEASLIGTQDLRQPLVAALQFPDLVVRIRAALALGAALPKSQFAGSQLVIPGLAVALTQHGREQVLVVDPNQGNMNRVVGALRNDDRDAIGETNYFAAMERGRSEFQTVSGVFISTDASDPSLGDALNRFRGESIYAKTPVVVLTGPGQSGLASDLALNDPYVEAVPASATDAQLAAALDRVRDRTGEIRLDADMALSMALQAAETLRRIVLDGQTPYDAGDAEPALIASLSSPNEQLQIVAASVLALLPTVTAQRAIAYVALDNGNDKSLRVAAFDSLAESAKNNANLLENSQISRLRDIVHRDPDLGIRSGATKAFGALNLQTDDASAIIRSYYGG